MKPKKTLLLPKLIGTALLFINSFTSAQTWNPSHSIGTINGVYNFSYNQTPSQLVEIYPAATPNTGLSYQWESSTTPTGNFNVISGATSSSYNIPGTLSQNTWYRRKTVYPSNGAYIYSNTIKISVVSTNWEDINYIREHDVLKTGYTTWTAVDQLAIGDKLQTTTYLDGLGRSIQKVSRETATPPSNPNNLWGDMVQFSQYDVYGREPVKYLPYTTTSQSGKLKTAPLTEQPQYYSATYSETAAYSTITFDNSPLNRVMNVKEPGTSWAASSGSSASYDMNGASDNVKIFSVDYVQGNAPILSSYNSGTYPVNSLYKLTYTDVNGKQVVEFIDKSGQLILKKVQLDNSPSGPYAGWICTYNVYDDYGLLRFQIQPEGVNYLANNSWSFAGGNGATILAEQVFQYNYDDKGRNIWKKAPGANALNMLYDVRDRMVFMQDGNQAALTIPQWTANLYDELDRPVVSTLYNTSSSISTLQNDINNASAVSTVTINNSGTSSVTATLSLNPISSSNLNNTSVCTPLKYLFYDNYSFPLVKTFDNNFTNTTAYSNSDPNVQPIAKTLRVTSMPTGSMVRVLGSTTFLASTHYYDERGSHIQTLEDNIKTGVDITTMQYHFDGRVLSTCNDHTTSNTGYTNFKTLTKYIFDKLGRVTSIQKKYGSNSLKTISTYDYDDVGRVKTKHLDPDYTNPNTNTADLESLNYSFNIHNQITGINKDFALKNPNNYNKWGHFFGLYLGYDNRDNVFTNAQLNGQVTGLVWNTQGDDAQRRYDYTYDNAGRLINSLFKEQKHSGDGWSNTTMDFSVSGSSGQITYDLNGNLLSMLQKGVVPGTSSPIVVDDLHYTYSSYSNKLQSVSDQMTSTSFNGLFGDFKDGVNGSNPDYVYDANGNVVIDLNKNAKDLNNVTGANGIHYNFLDKPDQIRIKDKGTIDIVYSADGEKLKRTFTPEGSGNTTVTTYINQFIYQSINGGADNLSFMNFEEGRIRIVTPTNDNNGYDALAIDGNIDLPNSKRGAYDYYIMDYQQNVRMILTEEIHSAYNTCTMERDRANEEDPVFGQQGGDNEVETTRRETPSEWSGNATAFVSQLGNNAGHSLGPNVLQKVMAGDKISAIVDYWHHASDNNNSSNFVNTLLGSLANAIVGNPATTNLIKGQATNITNQLNANNIFLDAIGPKNINYPAPKAYLTILFFDERFNFISPTDGGIVQQQVLRSVDENGAMLGLTNIKAPKNGYVYVYLSNLNDDDVYFDNFKVQIDAGNIIEENHYYSYGLKIATISSKKLGDANEGVLDNKYQMQGEFAEMDDDIGWNDFALRNYDPQVGRWVQQDPYQEFASPYLGMGNDPVNTIDPSGGLSWPPPGLEFLNAAGKAASVGAEATSTVSKVLEVSSMASISLISKIGFIAKALQITSLIINTSIVSAQVGNPCCITPDGQKINFIDDGHLEFFDGNARLVGDNLTIQPMGGSLKAFTMPDNYAIDGNNDNVSFLRFVATFDPKSGKFMGYAYDKDLSYTFDNYLKSLEKDINDQYEHINDPTYQHYNSSKEAGMAALQTGTTLLIPVPLLKAGTIAINASRVLLKLEKSVEAVMGKTYRAIKEVVDVVKNTELLAKLNAASKGKGVWQKVYQAGIQDGKKIEVHFFRNSKTGEVFDVKIKYNYWHQKAFKNIMTN